MKTLARILTLLAVSFIITTSQLTAQWTQTNNLNGGLVLCFAASGTNLFAGTFSGGVFLSTNNGESWTAVNNGLWILSIWSLAVSGTNLFAATWGDGVYRSTDNGENWQMASTGLTNFKISSLAVLGTNLFAMTTGKGVFRSTNNGANWTAVNNGSPSYGVLGVSGTNLFAGTIGYGIYRSTDNGESWTAVNNGLTNLNVRAFAVSDTILFASTDDGVHRSTDNGESWTKLNNSWPYSTTTYALAVSDTNLFAGTNHGVYLSTVNGESWAEVNNGLTTKTVWSLVVSGTNLFAGTNGSSVFRRPLSEMITSVEVIPGQIPSYFNLKQNYPNPFNPTTTIEFSLPITTDVSLKVFDALGREVATLISEQFNAGTYATQWNAEGLPSGVYFYRLQAGDFIQSKKLILLR